MSRWARAIWWAGSTAAPTYCPCSTPILSEGSRRHRVQPHAFIVRKAAVLGAGVMGAQIAAHLVNANVTALLYELPAKEGDPNGNVRKAIDNLARLEPSPLASAGRAAQIEARNYDQHLSELAECDLVIEAISERLDWKADLYRKVAP